MGGAGWGWTEAEGVQLKTTPQQEHKSTIKTERLSFNNQTYACHLTCFASHSQFYLFLGFDEFKQDKTSKVHSPKI